MSDLVGRLRMDIEPSEGDMEAAADEIERLRTALREIAYAKPECCEITNAMQFIARAALEETK